MAEAPEIQEAKEKLRKLVPVAVDKLAGLMDSEHDGIRLGASKEVLDRGGVPAKQDHHVSIEVGLDEEIEQLIAGVRRQVEGKKTAEQYTADLIEDAEVVEDALPLPLGEQAAKLIGVPVDDRAPEPEEVEVVEAWWQAAPE